MPETAIWIFYEFGKPIDVFAGRSFGPNFHSRNEDDARCIDFVAHRDEKYIKAGKLTPSHGEY